MLKKLTKKYSEFINFPIFLKTSKEVSREVPVEVEEVEEGDEEVVEDVEGGDDVEGGEDEDFVVEDDVEEEPKTRTVKETVWEW